MSQPLEAVCKSSSDPTKFLSQCSENLRSVRNYFIHISQWDLLGYDVYSIIVAPS